MQPRITEPKLCNTCKECTKRYPSVFQLDANGKAYITAAEEGEERPFRIFVGAGELCQVDIIHPGVPLAYEPNMASLLKPALKIVQDVTNNNESEIAEWKKSVEESDVVPEDEIPWLQ